MKVTVLIENTSQEGLACEHGLSLLIEDEYRRVLLDAGSTGAFYENASRMGISLEGLSAVALSHGHYDHSGGFEILLERHKEVLIYAQRQAMDAYYSGVGELHAIGIPEAVHAQRDRFILLDGAREILKGVYLIPHSTAGLEEIGARAKLYKMEDGALNPDDFSHEQSLVFDTARGLIIFNGCSHGGVETIIREAKAACGNRRVCAYVGGLHMKGKANGEEICAFTDAQVEEMCKTIEAEGIVALYTGHCTGMPGLRKLQARLGDSVHALTAGMQFEI